MSKIKEKIRNLEKMFRTKEIPSEDRIQVIEKDDSEKMEGQIKHIQTKLLEKYGTLEGATFVIASIKRAPLPGDFTCDLSLQEKEHS